MLLSSTVVDVCPCANTDWCQTKDQVEEPGRPDVQTSLPIDTRKQQSSTTHGGGIGRQTPAGHRRSPTLYWPHDNDAISTNLVAKHNYTAADDDGKLCW